MQTQSSCSCSFFIFSTQFFRIFLTFFHSLSCSAMCFLHRKCCEASPRLASPLCVNFFPFNIFSHRIAKSVFRRKKSDENILTIYYAVALSIVKRYILTNNFKTFCSVGANRSRQNFVFRQI